MDILQAQLTAQQSGRAYALVTLVQADGTTPRSTGSKMIVYQDGATLGSVGGGVMEKQIIPDAVLYIQTQQKGLRTYENRAEESDTPCGFVTVFIEAAHTAPTLVICGAGHVGGCVVRMAAQLGYHVMVVDTRATEVTAENAKQANTLTICENFYEGLTALDVTAQAYYLIATFGHAQDGEALAAVLNKDARYIGMLGSPQKIQAIFEKLNKKGYDKQLLGSVHSPVGLDIGGETPEEIAISIIAEMQMVRYGRTGRSLQKAEGIDGVSKG